MGFNLALHVDDDPSAVAENRRALARELAPTTHWVWLTQVHGTAVAYADPLAATPAVADALWTDQPGICCCVLTADCLPVMVCARDGGRVAAIHAGWRGLAAGVIEATLGAMNLPGSEAFAWLGPAIGSDAFEVGPEVRDAFLERAGTVHRSACEALFSPSPRRPAHYLADLRGLAELRLRALGVAQIVGENACTVGESERFFSYRRDGQTGRMATFIIRP